MDQKHSYHSGKWITLIGFCTAMEIILARFLSLHTWNLKIGLSFLPVAAAALIGGPLAGGLTGALGDPPFDDIGGTTGYLAARLISDLLGFAMKRKEALR